LHEVGHYSLIHAVGLAEECLQRHRLRVNSKFLLTDRSKFWGDSRWNLLQARITDGQALRGR